MRFFYFFLLGVLGCVSVCRAGDIRAIVNDTPISAFDVDTRARMIQLQQTGRVGKITADLRQTALTDLIDEQIKNQEAARRKVTVSDEEVADAVAHLERQNGQKAGGFKKLLQEQKISYQALTDQIRSNLGWLKVMRRAGASVAVSPAELKAREKIIRRELATESLSFAEIVVKTLTEAESVLERLQNGGDFKTMVDLYSTADSRLNGGRVDGVTRQYYGAAAADILGHLSPGEVSDPFPVKGGYAIVLMLNRRDAVRGDFVPVWELSQVLLPPDSDVHARLLSPVENGCDGFRDLVYEAALPNTFRSGQVSPSQLPADILSVLEDAPLKQVIGPLKTPMGVLYFMKCHVTKQRVMPTEAELTTQIEAEKAELLSEQLLSELKRDAVIEYK